MPKKIADGKLNACRLAATQREIASLREQR